jgi:hypothetical protein
MLLARNRGDVLEAHVPQCRGRRLRRFRMDVMNAVFDRKQSGHVALVFGPNSVGRRVFVTASST